jgi:tetratricopeptide (TPR) repeat protein
LILYDVLDTFIIAPMKITWYVLCTTIISSALSSVVSELQAKRIEDAKSYFIEAKMAQDVGELKESIPFYRAALRLRPDSVEYLTALGMVEFQLGHYAEAAKRFRKVLTFEPASTSAKYYIKMINSKMKKAPMCFGGQCEMDEVVPPTYNPVPELPSDVLQHCATSGSTCDNFPAFSEHSVHPFVLRGAMQQIAADLSAFQPAVLNASFANLNVDFYPQNMLSKPNKVYTVPLHKALDYLAYPEGAYLSVDASEPGTYIQWNMNETVWDIVLERAGLLHTIPPVFAHSLDTLLHIPRGDTEAEAAIGPDGAHTAAEADPGAVSTTMSSLSRAKHSFGYKTHWYMLLIGEEGSGMFPHQDTLAVGSWQAQVAGSKLWRLCSPESTAMKPKEHSDRNEDEEAEDDTLRAVDSCYETTLSTGDLIYYPPYYWHETRNMETPSVSLSGTVVVDAYRRELLDMLKGECEDDTKGFDFDSAVCALLR